MRTTWKVTLYNQHAMQSVHATGRTRRKAFLNAYHSASKTFLSNGVVSPAVQWLAVFNDCMAYMRRGCTADTLSLPQGISVEIRRVSKDFPS